jgi:hypothetical protein
MTIARTRLFPTAFCSPRAPFTIRIAQDSGFQLRIKAAQTVLIRGSAKRESYRFTSEAQGFWPALDRGWKSCAGGRVGGSLFCPFRSPVREVNSSCSRGNGRGLGASLLLLSCYRSLDGRPNSWHSVRFLHGRRNWESRGLAGWTPMAVRASSFFWSTDGEGFHAKGQPDGQSDYVVCGSDIFRRGSNSGRVVRVAFGGSGEQAVSSFFAWMGSGDVGK